MRESLSRDQFAAAHRALKAQIKERAAAGRSLRQSARDELGHEKGEKAGASRHQKHLAALREGKAARGLLLAYGWLKGRPALALEGLSTRTPAPLYDAAMALAPLVLAANVRAYADPRKGEAALYADIDSWYRARLAPADQGDALLGGEGRPVAGTEGGAVDARSAVAAE